MWYSQNNKIENVEKWKSGKAVNDRNSKDAQNLTAHGSEGFLLLV